MLADWLAGLGRDWSSGWLSLDPDDSDPARYWPYVVTALQRAAPGVGAIALDLLSFTPVKVALGALINDLADVTHDVVLVLDDYHVVDGPAVEDGMSFLIDHLPANIHLVIATRADPALPLARLRVRGELVEIRAQDLRFTSREAARYLNEVMGLALTADSVDALERRTEGWAAALQLAALSIQGRSDAADFIASFAGNNRYVVDYLAEEVLQRQPEPTRRFLLETSILTRFKAPLCDAVTGHEGSKSLLEHLDRANLFLVALDARREWYRYHQLFADVLQAHLREEAPDLLPVLHRRASDWYEEHGERADAIRHALEAGDGERAAELIELAVPEARRTRQEATRRRWVEALPDEIVRTRPVLDVAYVGALLTSGEFEGVDARLRDAERRLGMDEGQSGPSAGAALVIGDRAELARLPSAVAMYRAALARIAGDEDATIAQARRAFDLAVDDDALARGAAAGFLGLAFWARGDLAAAQQSWEDAVTSLWRAGHISDVLGCSIGLADIEAARGRLRAALRTYERGLDLGDDPGAAPVRGVADMHVGLGEVLLERNDVAGASQHLLRSGELGEQLGLPQNPYRWRVARARLRQAEGDLEGAVKLLDEAERRYASDFFPNVRPIAAVKARVWVAQGRVGEALAWARGAGLSTDDEPTYLREYEHITLTRALLATARTSEDRRALDDALRLLERLLEAAARGGRERSVIELRVVQALALEALGQRDGARASLERAVELAEPEGYVRVFADEGEGVVRLLKAVARRAPTSYLTGLVTAIEEPQRRPGAQPLFEPLSDRELDVLRLLASDLAGPEIARNLFVSLNTLRTHTKNIFAKLGVSSRRAAVSRAAELGLLSQRRG